MHPFNDNGALAEGAPSHVDLPALLSDNASLAQSGVKDRWHQLADAIGNSNLPASDKAIFRYLLDRADYKTAELPPRFTPTQRAMGRKTSHSVRQVKYSLAHLGRHGWVITFAMPGDDRRLGYWLDAGQQCSCTGRRHVTDADAFAATRSATQEKVQRRRSTEDQADDDGECNGCGGSIGSQSYSTNGENRCNAAGQTTDGAISTPETTAGIGATAQKGATGDGELAGATEPGDRCNSCTGIGATDRCNAAGQTACCTERQREGRVEEETTRTETLKPGAADDTANRECSGGCGKPARHGCATCWEHAHLELARPLATLTT